MLVFGKGGFYMEFMDISFVLICVFVAYLIFLIYGIVVTLVGIVKALKEHKEICNEHKHKEEGEL